VIYIHCFLGPQIKPEGFSNWNQTDNYKTARYAEFENYGPGANESKRVSWEKQLSENQIKNCTIENVLGGWIPAEDE